MIEKLDRHIKTEENGIRISCPPTHADCIDKINELVDAVNVLQSQVAILQEHAHPTATTEPTDPYAEQRKWIGKLCRFWDEKEEEKVFGILTTIDSDCGLSDMCPYWNDTTKNWFEHCEPVKDDIIYKGGDNE